MSVTSASRIGHLLVLGLLVLLASASDAWAYVDPGAGSYLFQLAAAGLLAGLYTVRTYLRALVDLIRGRRGEADPPSAPSRANDMD